MCVKGKKKLNQLHSVLSNRDINLCACRLLLLTLLFDLVLSMVVQCGIVIRIRLVL